MIWPIPKIPNFYEPIIGFSSVASSYHLAAIRVQTLLAEYIWQILDIELARLKAIQYFLIKRFTYKVYHGKIVYICIKLNENECITLRVSVNLGRNAMEHIDLLLKSIENEIAETSVRCHQNVVIFNVIEIQWDRKNGP